MQMPRDRKLWRRFKAKKSKSKLGQVVLSLNSASTILAKAPSGFCQPAVGYRKHVTPVFKNCNY